MKKIIVVCAAIMLGGQADANENQLATAGEASRDIVPGRAIVVDVAQAYSFPDTAIRLVLVNRDLYAMLDKYSGTKGHYVACAEIYQANQFAGRQMYFTDFFGNEHGPSVADRWRQRVAADAVGKQATYVGFDCKVGSLLDLTPVLQKVALAVLANTKAAGAASTKLAAETELQEREKQTRARNFEKFRSIFGNYHSNGKIVADFNLLILPNNDTPDELYLRFSWPTETITLRAKMPDDRTFVGESGSCRIEFKIENWGRTLSAAILPPITSDCKIEKEIILLSK